MLFLLWKSCFAFPAVKKQEACLVRTTVFAFVIIWTGGPGSGGARRRQRRPPPVERPPELGFLPAGQRKSSMGDPDMLENELFFTYGWQRWVNNSKLARKSNQKYLWTYFENCTTKSRLFFCFLLWKITLWLVFSAFRKQKQKSTLTKRTLTPLVKTSAS